MNRYYDWYPPSVPKAVEDGIKAQSKRGAFAQQWWGKQWIATLERFHDSARLARGRSYARKGQVTELSITTKGVSARVQGSRKTPYKVSIRLEPYSKKEWTLLIGNFLEQPIHAAKLLGGNMDENIESICKKSGMPLFPGSYRELETTCSCPDYSNPCKHLAAVLYLMAEAFDRDPFLLFTLRGMDKEAFLKAIGGNRNTLKPEQEPDPQEPLPVEHEAFWASATLTLPPLTHTPAKIPAALVKRLGPLPFWRSERNFMAEMESIYTRAASYKPESIFFS